MRLVVLAILAIMAIGIGACSQAGNLHQQIIWTGGVGYDVRSTTTSGSPPTYEASAAYNNSHKVERPQITRNLLFRGATRVKADGYDYVLVQGPADGKVTSTSYQNGRATSSVDYPAFKFKLTGYKRDEVRLPQSVEVDKLLAQLKPQVTDS
jgi:hypothetical protein